MTGESWLDVGCNNGATVQALREVGIASYGVDLFGGMHSTLTASVPIMCAGEQRTIQATVASYYDVIEHPVNPLGMLARTLPLGVQRVVIECPDYETADSPEWRHYKPDEHLHHFTETSLKLLVDAVLAPKRVAVYRPVPTKLGLMAWR